MYIVQDRTKTQTVESRIGKSASSCRIRTTLYELIEALQTVVPPEADAVVIATVVRLLRSGQITFLHVLQCSRL
jgi:hypothetical protein